MRALVKIGFAAMLLGCQPSIGDNCIQSTDCSAAGDRLCDTSQPNGYCTIFSCLPNLCPLEAACVATNISVLGCPYDDRHSPSRTSRQLCLKKCQHDSDCRVGEGYACITPSEYGVLVMDTDQTEKVCLPATSYVVSDAASDGVAPVCQAAGPDAGSLDAGPGYQGDAGADAADGSADAESDAGADAADAADDAPADALAE